MADLFKDPAQQDAFNRNGYAQLDLLTTEEAHQLRQVYHELMGETGTDKGRSHLFESSRTHDIDWNMRMNSSIREAVTEPITHHFKDYELFGGTFMVKVPRVSTLLPLHQDWSIVDEDRYQSVFIWCPLVDIRPENGGLFVLPGSHLYFNNYRSGSMPSFRIEPEGKLKDHVVDIRLSAGQALAYSDRLFHGSYPNTTDDPRIVATARVNEKSASLVYYHQADDSTVEIIKASPEFYLTDANRLDRGERPEGFETLRTLSYKHESITDNDLLEKLPRI